MMSPTIDAPKICQNYGPVQEHQDGFGFRKWQNAISCKFTLESLHKGYNVALHLPRNRALYYFYSSNHFLLTTMKASEGSANIPNVTDAFEVLERTHKQ